MKKTSYHVNPAVNKWEEEQRRARMEKMIQRAKSTLPPEARGGTKTSGPKKPSPYTAENNAAKPLRKRSTAGGLGTPSGPAAVDVKDLDNLIYHRVQEILGMPLMRRAAAARDPAKAGAREQKASSGSRGARRPAWNDDWNAQQQQAAASPPPNQKDRPIGGVQGARSGSSYTAYERSPSKSSATGGRSGAPHGPGPTGSPTKASRIPLPGRIEVPSGGSGAAGLQRRPSGRVSGPEERVVLLPSPSAGPAVNRATMPRPGSSRYGSEGGAHGASAAAGGTSGGALLGESVVAAIEALNPHAPAAREAANRIAQHQQGTATARRLGPASSGGNGALAARHSLASGDVAASRHLSGGASTAGAGGFDVGGCDASLMQSVTAAALGASQGGSPSTAASVNTSTRRPPLAPRASGRSGPLATQRSSPDAKGHQDEDEEEYADDDFEEYQSSDEERSAPQPEEGAAEEDGDGYHDGGAAGGAAGVAPDVALLRDSVQALNGLVQLKIQQELACGQQQHQQQQDEPCSTAGRQSLLGTADLARGSAAARPSSSRQRLAGAAAGTAPDVLASLALVGSEESEGRGASSSGRGGGGLASSSLGDGLRQSDLDYLARLGGGELPLEGGLDVAASAEERPFLIEPGVPAGTAKAWGDRQPWTGGELGAHAGATGLQKLRERQEREWQMQVQQQGRQQAAAAGEQRLSQQRLSGSGQATGAPPQSGGGGGGNAVPLVAPVDEEDSVLLGETLTPRHRAGATAQMQAVGSALAALASSGRLSAEDAEELRTQTDALYGSLVQLHHLMNGPRGAELCSSSPSRLPAGGSPNGFTPAALSPSDSPTQSVRRPDGGPGPAQSQFQWAAEERTRRPVEMRLEPTEEGEVGYEGGGAHAARPGGAVPPHLQLTPKHQLVAADVAWLAGLAQSLSASLRVENGEVELPGV